MIFEKLKFKFNTETLVATGFAIILISLINNNSETDAYAYAISVKTGQNIISPHHILNCFPAHFLFLLVKFIGISPNALLILKLINAVSAGVCIYFLGKILKLLKSKKILEFLIFAGSCYGFMRFATEGETYIIPIMFSIVATYFFILFYQNSKTVYLLISGLIFAISILFHQIHIFWFAGFALALLIEYYKKNFSRILIFAFPCLALVFTIYFFASLNANSSFINFVFHDYITGKANIFVGLNHFKMLPVSLARTFVQIHGYMFFIFKKYNFLIGVTLISACFTAFFIYKFLKSLKYHKTEKTVLQRAVLVSFVLQFLFAFYSVSNAEFMVMLPFLVIIWVDLKYDFNKKYLLFFSSFLLMWNLCFGLIPLHFADIDGSKNLLSKVKNETWIFYNPQKMENMGEYYYGPNSIKNFSRLDSLEVLLKDKNTKYILTDHFNENEGLNRRKLLLKKDKFYNKFNSFERMKVDSFYSSFGKKYIFKVNLK